MPTPRPTPDERLGRPLPRAVAAIFFVFVAAALAGLLRVQHGSWARAGRSLLAPSLFGVVLLGVWQFERRAGRRLAPRVAAPLFGVLAAATSALASPMVAPPGRARWAMVAVGALYGALIGVSWGRGARR